MNENSGRTGKPSIIQSRARQQTGLLMKHDYETNTGCHRASHLIASSNDARLRLQPIELVGDRQLDSLRQPPARPVAPPQLTSTRALPEVRRRQANPP